MNISNFAFQPGSIRSLFLICLLLVVGSVLSAGWQVALKAEFGALELASFVCLAIAAIVSGSFYADKTIQLWAVPYVFALLALREMDFQNWWFEPGLLRAETLTASVPLWHKAVSGMAMGAIVVTLLVLVTKGTRPFLSALSLGAPWALALLASVLSVLLSIVFDGAERNFAAINVTLSPAMLQATSYLEEVVEFAFAFLLVVSVILFARHTKANSIR